VLYKKRWSDGLHDDFEHLDEFQFKFGLFGGDGGGGGGGTSKAEQDAKAAAQEPDRGMSMPDVGFRGEQSAAAQGVRDAALGKARQQDAADRVQDMVSRAVFDSGYYDKPATQNAPGLADMFPNAVVAPTRPSALDNISLTTPDTPSFNMPTISDLMNMTETIPANVPANVPTNVPTSNLGLNQFQVGPGTLTVNPEVSDGKGLTGAAIDYSVPIGPVSSLQPTGNPMVDAMISGMQNAAANPAPPSTQVASSDSFNVFGTLTSPLEFVGNNLAKKGNTYTSASSGGITSTRRQPSMYDKVTRTGKSLADQIGIGSLFGN